MHGRAIPQLGLALLIFSISLFVTPVAMSQEGQDYYGPHTEAGERNLWRDTELYHLGPGYKDLADKKYAGAMANATFTLRWYPNNPKALNLLSEVCTKWKSPQCDAEEWFQRAIAMNPSISETYVVYGIHLHRAGRLKQAIIQYQKALELDPNSSNAHYNIGLAYVDMKEYDLANEHAQQSYAAGAPFPGLRDKLKKAGHWNPSVESAPSPNPLPDQGADDSKAESNPAR